MKRKRVPIKKLVKENFYQVKLLVESSPIVRGNYIVRCASKQITCGNCIVSKVYPRERESEACWKIFNKVRKAYNNLSKEDLFEIGIGMLNGK